MATEKRLIDANALLNKAYWHGKIPTHGCLYPEGSEAVDVDDIENAPTVDAVEVKCKVGDLVYALWEAPVKLKYIIYCAEVKEIRVSMRNCRLTTTYILEPIDYRGRRREYRDNDFGTLVFKNQEDAESKLYPCVNCLSGTYRSCEGCSYGERKDNEID
jgi:hypothetical protein